MQITIGYKGSFDNTEKFFDGAQKLDLTQILAKYGEQGVMELSLATPKDTGETASSWGYAIVDNPGYFELYWYNSFEEEGIMPAILIQYGHGTRYGAYVQPNDYINPAIGPILDSLADDIWKEVCDL